MSEKLPSGRDLSKLCQLLCKTFSRNFGDADNLIKLNSENVERGFSWLVKMFFENVLAAEKIKG